MATPSVPAPPHVVTLLQSLHAKSLEQEAVLAAGTFNPATQANKTSFDALMLDKFIALEEDKCAFVYNLLRAINARTVVEAGTSFGVSTIYLALAVGQNASGDAKGRVIATEKEEEKAERAREYWAQAGSEVEDVIDLRVGDLRETLKGDLGVVDFLLLDSELHLSSFGFNAKHSRSLDPDGSARIAARRTAHETRRAHHRGQHHGRRGGIQALVRVR